MAQHGVVHVINGSAAASTLRQALRLELSELLVSHDLYSCGPLLPIRSLIDWRQGREDWWAQLYAAQGVELSKELFDDFDIFDHVDVLRNTPTIRVWTGVGLGDQLLLVWLPQFLRSAGVSEPQLEVIQYDRIGTGPRGAVIGTGQLNPDQMRSHPEPTTLQADEIGAIDAAWTALTAAEPAALISLLSSGNASLPLLERSLRSLLKRYPDCGSGLGIWDHAALQYTVRHTAEKAPQAVRVVAAMMTHDLNQPDWPGDSYLYSRMQRVAAPGLAHPLLSLSEPNKPMRETTAAITEAGRAVLNGEANAVELNGIDDWVAGVHLDSNAGRVWFHRDGELVPAG